MSQLRLANISNLTRNAAWLAMLDQGADAAVLEMLDGDPPSAPEAAALARVLGRIVLQRPAGIMVGTAVRLLASGDGTVLLSGVARWARIVNAQGQVAGDGLCSDADGPGPFRLASLQLYRGGVLRLVSAVVG